MKPLRFLLMIVLLAFLPLQAWAGLGTTVSGTERTQAKQAVTIPHGNVAAAVSAPANQSGPADFATLASLLASDTSSPADNAEPSPPGADFAEQLLPAPLPRLMVSAARGAVPYYTGAPLPDPDLPLPPRPPRG